MIKNAIVPLDAYRLAGYAVPLDCYICDGQNTHEAEFCRYCLAPMALARQATNPKAPPRMIGVVGASGAGKTVYLGMLMDMLSRQPDGLKLVARGAFSVTLQQTTVAALARREFPEKTPNEPDRWNWVHGQVRHPRQRNPVELIMPDMAGESILQEIDHPHSYEVIRSFLRKCSAAMVLIDAAKLREGGLDQDYFTMKLISYLAELTHGAKNGWLNRPVAMIFTKADQCDAWTADPDRWAKNHATRLWQQCRERFCNHRFFAVQVAGTCIWRETLGGKRVHVPLRIEPHGVLEPFRWILGQTAGRRWAT